MIKFSTIILIISLSCFGIIGIGMLEITLFNTYIIADSSCYLMSLGNDISEHKGINSSCINIDKVKDK